MVIPPYDIIIIIYLYAITVILCRRQQKKSLSTFVRSRPLGIRIRVKNAKSVTLARRLTCFGHRVLGFFFFLQTLWFGRDTLVTTGEYPHTVRRDDEQPRRWSGAKTQRQQGQRGRRVQGERPVGG